MNPRPSKISRIVVSLICWQLDADKSWIWTGGRVSGRHTSLIRYRGATGTFLADRFRRSRSDCQPLKRLGTHIFWRGPSTVPARGTVMQVRPPRHGGLLLLSGRLNARVAAPAGNSSRMLRVALRGRSIAAANSRTACSLPEPKLWNMYGPTETTIWSLIHNVDQGAENQADTVSVGRPIANTKAIHFR